MEAVICEVCGGWRGEDVHPVEECVCPVCDVCGKQGDPKCINTHMDKQLAKSWSIDYFSKGRKRDE